MKSHLRLVISNMSEKQQKKGQGHKIQEHKLQFEQMLNCQICYCKASQPTMCPHCSKLYCQNCISKSLKLKAECPNCRKLIKGQLTNCSRFINELSNIVHTLIESGQQLQRCEEHDINLNYFCEDCQKSACCECKMFGQHQNHTFKSISIIYQQKYERIREMLSELKSKIIEKEELMNNMENDLIEIKAKTEAQLIEIDEYTDKFRSKIMKENVNDSSNQYQNIQSLVSDIAALDQIKQQLLFRLEQAKKHNCYRYDMQLINKLELVLNKNKESCQSNQNVLVIDEAIPPFQKYQIIIDNYSQLKLQKGPIYSKTSLYEGSQWRLVVYLRGNNNDGQNLSIFLELLKNPDTLNQYQYQIELYNHLDSKKSVVKEHHSKFQVGQCWGYNKFIKLSEIEQLGFVNEQADTIYINYGLKFSYYCDLYKRRQLILDQYTNKMKEQDIELEALEAQMISDSKNSIDLP